MKQIVLFWGLMCCFCAAKAQTFFIPDSNFFNAIIQTQPACTTCVVNYATREMDSACVGSVGVLHISNKNITNLSGIEYFVGLGSLFCDHNALTSIDTLPNSLSEIYVHYNQLTSLPTALPSNLWLLNCAVNQLTSLPTLPNTYLQQLECSYNKLTSLPALPNSLWIIGCEGNKLTSLPTLPNNLIDFHCSYNKLTSLPTLPNSLWIFHFSDNRISCIPNIPPGLFVFSI